MPVCARRAIRCSAPSPPAGPAAAGCSSSIPRAPAGCCWSFPRGSTADDPSRLAGDRPSGQSDREILGGPPGARGGGGDAARHQRLELRRLDGPGGAQGGPDAGPLDHVRPPLPRRADLPRRGRGRGGELPTALPAAGGDGRGAVPGAPSGGGGGGGGDGGAFVEAPSRNLTPVPSPIALHRPGEGDAVGAVLLVGCY